MKYSLVASKELADFLREKCNIEETNWKSVTKLAKQAGGCCAQGTFAPYWLIFRSTADRLATIHMQMVQKLGELVKDISKYSEELHKKHKSFKEEENSTLDIVQSIQSTSVSLQKARDLYNQRTIELEKLKKETASPKELEKAEQKLKKTQDECKVLVEKYTHMKEDFDRKMPQACKHFKEIEEEHLLQMKEFLISYSDLLDNNHEQMGQVHTDFKSQFLDLSVENLIEEYTQSKKLGLQKLADVEIIGDLSFCTPDDVGKIINSSSVSSVPQAVTGSVTSITSNTVSNTAGSKWEGFLRSRRYKRKDKKAKKNKKETSDSLSNKDEKSDPEEKEENANSKSKTPTPEVDEEGYCIQPKLDSWESYKGTNFYSSSDTESEEEKERKIKVEIKPIKNGSAPISASVDELRATVENMTLSPLGMPLNKNGPHSTLNHMKRSQSVSQQIGGNKLTNDFSGLHMKSPTGSSASTPTAAHPYAPLQSPTPPINTSSNKYADLNELFSDLVETQPPLPARQRQTPPPSLIALPRPPSRRSEGVKSPPLTNNNVGEAGEFRTAGVAAGISRGPSPLTIGMTDTIPIAVAFQEIIHTYFKGSDESKCQVKLCGDMMLSFPAGIISLLANNPTPAQLSFRVKSLHRFENILPNKQLVSIDAVQTNQDGPVFEFNMSALISLLLKQCDQNPSASYFNVDILKYQIKAKPGADSCPLHLVAYWKCEPSQTDLKIDYKYNSHAMALASPLLNVSIAVPVDGGVKRVQSKPNADWKEDSQRLVWRFTEVSQHSEGNGVGSLRARLELVGGPSQAGIVGAQFNCEGTTLSGAEFGLVGSGYRVSLVKRRFVSGKYICDGDPDSKYRYATLPALSS